MGDGTLKVKILIFTGYGLNADKELKWAFDIAGGEADIVHLEDIIENPGIIDRYNIIAFPGGFSFGDHLSSGKIYANIVRYKLFDKIRNFIENGKLVIGICNGFQIITRLGIVPSLDDNYKQTVSLLANDSGHFEDRWITVKNNNPNSPWLAGIDTMSLPVRHGEGRLVGMDENVINRLKNEGHIALTYINPNGGEAVYPFNPNGSTLDIAGITNAKGNVLGLMPHPEAYICREQHPNWTEGYAETRTGLDIFKNGINYFK